MDDERRERVVFEVRYGSDETLRWLLTTDYLAAGLRSVAAITDLMVSWLHPAAVASWVAGGTDAAPTLGGRDR